MERFTLPRIERISSSKPVTSLEAFDMMSKFLNDQKIQQQQVPSATYFPGDMSLSTSTQIWDDMRSTCNSILAEVEDKTSQNGTSMDREPVPEWKDQHSTSEAESIPPTPATTTTTTRPMKQEEEEVSETPMESSPTNSLKSSPQSARSDGKKIKREAEKMVRKEVKKAKKAVEKEIKEAKKLAKREAKKMKKEVKKAKKEAKREAKRVQKAAKKKVKSELKSKRANGKK